MLMNRTERLALIHLAKKECGLDDSAYRGLLEGAANVSSAAAIDSEAQFDAIMSAFSALGFTRRPAVRKRLRTSVQRDDTEKKYASPRQLYYINGLWELASRNRDEASLRAMIKRIGKVDDIRFITRRNASALILALRDICWKAGFDPDEAPRFRKPDPEEVSRG